MKTKTKTKTKREAFQVATPTFFQLLLLGHALLLILNCCSPCWLRFCQLFPLFPLLLFLCPLPYWQVRVCVWLALSHCLWHLPLSGYLSSETGTSICISLLLNLFCFFCIFFCLFYIFVSVLAFFLVLQQMLQNACQQFVILPIGNSLFVPLSRCRTMSHFQRSPGGKLKWIAMEFKLISMFICHLLVQIAFRKRLDVCKSHWLCLFNIIWFI